MLARLAPCLAVAALLGASGVSAHPALDAQVADLTRAIAARPADATLYLQRAQVLAEHRDLDAARADLARALELDARLLVAALALARLELDAGRPAEALAPVTRFLAANPGHAEGLVTRARALSALGRAEAAPAWSSALSAAEMAGHPLPELYLEAARVLDGEAAVVVLERGIARLGRVGSLVEAAARAEANARRVDAAVTRCREAAAAASEGSRFPWLVLEGDILSGAAAPEDEAPAAREARRTAARDAYSRALLDIATIPPRAQASSLVREAAATARARLAELGP